MSEHVARIDFLGTGNAFSPQGRMHALALIDNQIMIDAPPTVVTQLRRAGVSPGQLQHILFTHWHGDHSFGFPFFLLDRKYLSDPGGLEDLEVHLRPGGRKYLTELCKMGFPGSLEDALENRVEWNELEASMIGKTGWKYDRFPVHHTPETDPHGYELKHESGFRLLHCGDSGPCPEIESRAGRVDVVILEMGMPDIGEFPHHHRPSDVISFNDRFPDVKVLVTHNYARSPQSKSGFEIPELPSDVVQLNDGDSIEIDESGNYTVNN
tara:strand:- start:45594 stop:46394 length:801 start_codon:yes stop_codon:yes gene_type:complete